MTPGPVTTNTLPVRNWRSLLLEPSLTLEGCPFGRSEHKLFFCVSISNHKFKHVTFNSRQPRLSTANIASTWPTRRSDGWQSGYPTRLSHRLKATCSLTEPDFRQL